MLLPSPQSNTVHVKPDHRYSVIVQNSIYDITERICEIIINGVLQIFESYKIGIFREPLSIIKTKQIKMHINKQKHRQKQKKAKQTSKNNTKTKQKYKTWFQEAAVRTDCQSNCSI
jgi:hypothetical protein